MWHKNEEGEEWQGGHGATSATAGAGKKEMLSEKMLDSPFGGWHAGERDGRGKAGGKGHHEER